MPPPLGLHFLSVSETTAGPGWRVSGTKNVLTATKKGSPIFKHLCKEDGREEEEAGFGYGLEVMWAC